MTLLMHLSTRKNGLNLARHPRLDLNPGIIGAFFVIARQGVFTQVGSYLGNKTDGVFVKILSEIIQGSLRYILEIVRIRTSDP